MTNTLHLRLCSSLNELARLTQAWEQFATSHGLPPELVSNINLVLDEVVVNIIKHGYGGRDDCSIDVFIQIAGSELWIRVVDDAPAFNPLQAPAPDLTVPLECRNAGGLGIYLVRELMDELKHEFTEGQNRLTMRRRLTDRDSTRPDR